MTPNSRQLLPAFCALAYEGAHFFFLKSLAFSHEVKCDVPSWFTGMFFPLEVRIQ